MKLFVFLFELFEQLHNIFELSICEVCLYD
jgi:hypothetical protein